MMANTDTLSQNNRRFLIIWWFCIIVIISSIGCQKQDEIGLKEVIPADTEDTVVIANMPEELGPVTIYTIYKGATDLEFEYAVKEWTIKGPIDNVQMIPGEILKQSNDLQEVIAAIPKTHERFGQFPGLEDPVILESWLPIQKVK